MIFEKFEGPWSDIEYLGCRNLFSSERLVLDLFEYQQSRPDEDIKVGTATVSGAHAIGLTETSRIWRLTFERPFALRMRDRKIRRRETSQLKAPAPCSFAEDSDWIREFEFDLRFLQDFRATHYIFTLLDDVIEIIADATPSVEKIPND